MYGTTVRRNIVCQGRAAQFCGCRACGTDCTAVLRSIAAEDTIRNFHVTLTGCIDDATRSVRGIAFCRNLVHRHLCSGKVHRSTVILTLVFTKGNLLQVQRTTRAESARDRSAIFGLIGKEGRIIANFHDRSAHKCHSTAIRPDIGFSAVLRKNNGILIKIRVCNRCLGVENSHGSAVHTNLLYIRLIPNDNSVFREGTCLHGCVRCLYVYGTAVRCIRRRKRNSLILLEIRCVQGKRRSVCVDRAAFTDRRILFKGRVGYIKPVLSINRAAVSLGIIADKVRSADIQRRYRHAHDRTAQGSVISLTFCLSADLVDHILSGVNRQSGSGHVRESAVINGLVSGCHDAGDLNNASSQRGVRRAVLPNGTTIVTR